MKFHDLRSFITELETAGELVRLSAELSPQYEVAAAIKSVGQKLGKAVLLEKVKGYDIPIVGNLLGSNRRLAISLGVREDDLRTAYLEGRSKPIKPRLITSAPVQEEVIDSGIDIPGTMPILTHHQKDAGPYMTCTFVVAKDPVTGMRGLGIHRIQIKGKDNLGIFLATPPLSDFLARAEERNKPLEIAVVSGADPVTYFASPQLAPQGIDKYDIAGGIGKAPLELVKCKSVDIEVPAYAEFVLEGYVIPHLREKEGPFGESTGYYLTYNNPVAKINVITHRTKPVYHALVPFGSEEEILSFPAYQIDTLVWLQGILPSVKQVYCPALGVVYVQLEKKTEEDARLVIEALFARATIPYSKIVMVVDADVDILNPEDIAWALGSRVRPDKDLIIQSNLPGLVIDPSTSDTKGIEELSKSKALTAKIGIDATKPLDEREKYERADVPLEVKLKIAKMLGI